MNEIFSIAVPAAAGWRRIYSPAHNPRTPRSPFGELAFGRSAGQFFDARLKFGRGAEAEDRLSLFRQNDPQHGANPPIKRVNFRRCLHGSTLPHGSAIWQSQNQLFRISHATLLRFWRWPSIVRVASFMSIYATL
jgi:hypothetical protein